MDFISLDESNIPEEPTCNTCESGRNCPRCSSLIRNDAGGEGPCLSCRREMSDDWYTCPECRRSFDTEQGMKTHRGKSHGATDAPVGKTETDCANCGEAIYRKVCHVEEFENSFCSNECQAEYLKVTEIDGERRYGQLWKERRETAIQQADKRCIECGIPRSEHYDQYGHDLHVHHKTPLRKFTSIEEAHEISNLEPLCSSCHGKKDDWDNSAQ